MNRAAASRPLAYFCVVLPLKWTLHMLLGTRPAPRTVAAAGPLVPPMPTPPAVLHVERASARPATAVPVAPVIAAVWFILALIAMLWTWGGVDPVYFPSPDEAVNRYAAQRIASTGLADIPLESADPEDLRHPRGWLTMGDRAIPKYPPAAYEIQGVMMSVPGIGPLLVVSLSAAGIAAFAVGVSLLGSTRRWAAALAPAMAFPALYWLLRPWMNISMLLALIAFALPLWAMWRRTHEPRWLWVAAAMIAAACAVRPDYAPALLLFALAVTLAESRKDETLASVLVFVTAGVVAVGLVLALNLLTTGDALTTAYEVADARRPESVRHGLPSPISKLYFLFLPEGFPSVGETFAQSTKYWLRLGPIALLTVAQVALMPLFTGVSRRTAAFYGVATAVALLFAVSRISGQVYGGALDAPDVRHSLPRYWAPLYLLATVPPLALIMSARRPPLAGPVLGLCVGVAVLGGWQVYDGQAESLTRIRALQERNATFIDETSRVVPPGALVYSINLDKVMWSHWEVATLPAGEPDGTSRAADSMRRAIDDGREVYIIQSIWTDPQRAALDASLRRRGLEITGTTHPAVLRVRPDEQAADRRTGA